MTDMKKSMKFLKKLLDKVKALCYNQDVPKRKEIKKMENIKNVPAYAYNHAWWVARSVDGELWFYGAYDTEERAREVAYMINGIIVEA